MSDKVKDVEVKKPDAVNKTVDVKKVDESKKVDVDPKVEKTETKIDNHILAFNKAKKEGLNSLTKDELVLIAENIGINADLKKDNLINKIHYHYIKELTQGKPIDKYVELNTNIIGYTTGVLYPVDKEIYDFFMKNKAVKLY